EADSLVEAGRHEADGIRIRAKEVLASARQERTKVALQLTEVADRITAARQFLDEAADSPDTPGPPRIVGHIDAMGAPDDRPDGVRAAARRRPLRGSRPPGGGAAGQAAARTGSAAATGAGPAARGAGMSSPISAAPTITALPTHSAGVRPAT